jgi:hypothetical protein
MTAHCFDLLPLSVQNLVIRFLLALAGLADGLLRRLLLGPRPASAPQVRRRTFQPSLMLLEARVVPATWTGLGDGVHWSDLANWSDDAQPNGAVVVLNPVNGATIADGKWDVTSVLSNGTLYVTGALTAQTFTHYGSVDLSGYQAAQSYTQIALWGWTGGAGSRWTWAA